MPRSIGAYNRRDVEVDWSESRGLDAGIYRGQDEVRAFIEELVRWGYECFNGVAMDMEFFHRAEALNAVGLEE